jgi:hypothetical protein
MCRDVQREIALAAISRLQYKILSAAVRMLAGADQRRQRIAHLTSLICVCDNMDMVRCGCVRSAGVGAYGACAWRGVERCATAHLALFASPCW